MCNNDTHIFCLLKEFEDEETEQHQAEIQKLTTELSVMWVKGDWVAIVYKDQ